MQEDTKIKTFNRVVTFGQLIGMAAALLISFAGFGAWQGATNQKVQSLEESYKISIQIIQTQTKILSSVERSIQYQEEILRRHEKKLDEISKELNNIYKLKNN